MKRVIISVVLLFVIAGLFLVSINGVRPHPYTEAELETVFLEKAEENGLSLEEGYEVVEKKHANSMTYLMEDVNGNHAWGTYVMTPLTEKYKSYDFYTDQMNLLSLIIFADLLCYFTDSLVYVFFRQQYSDLICHNLFLRRRLPAICFLYVLLFYSIR